MNAINTKTQRHKERPRIRIVYAAVLCAFVSLCLFDSAQAQGTYTLDQVFAKMDEVQKTFRSVEANMERTHVTVLVNDKDISSGKFYYTRSGKEPRVKLEITKPLTQYLLIDKGKLQIYTPNTKTVQEASLAGRQETVEMFMALGFGQASTDLKKNFEVALAADEVVDGKKTTVLDLKPKDSRLFKSIRMWMDQKNWVAVQIKTTETSNDHMTIKFTNMKLNTKLGNSVFDLKMPKDVRVTKL